MFWIKLFYNGSKNIEELTQFCNGFGTVDLISLGENKGIAAATNVALKEFINHKYDFVLKSDQDSCYPADYIQNFKTNKDTLICCAICQWQTPNLIKKKKRF